MLKKRKYPLDSDTVRGLMLCVSSKKYDRHGGTAMLKIGEFSKLSRVSVRMLRHYDEVGLLAPSEVDSMTGYRY